MSLRAIAPLRDEVLVDEDGYASLPTQVFLETIESAINGANADRVTLGARVTELEPTYNVITSADSPYSIANNEYVLADMSTGSITIVLPGAGRHYVSRSGASNTLTLQGTVEGEVNPTVISDGDSPDLAFIGTEYRYT